MCRMTAAFSRHVVTGKRFWWIAICTVELVLLGAAIAKVFATPENMAAPTFGTAWAPYSDALGPWLEGGFSFLLGLSPPTYLYRPTIGLFWGSILAAIESVAGIPLFFVGW